MPPLESAEESVVFERLSAGNAVIDRENGIIKGVKVIGFESANGRYYPPELLKRSVHLYEGAKVFIDHTDKATGRKYGERFGSLKNARFVEGQGVFADHHVNPEHPLAKQYFWDAEHAPDSVGFSHTASIRFAKKPDTKGRKVVEEIGQVLSVDLVAEPATTKGLFESQSPEMKDSAMNLKDMTFADLQRARPDLVEAADNRAVEKLGMIVTLMIEAGLNPANQTHFSPFFLKQMLATPDYGDQKELIADRAAAAKVATDKRIENIRSGSRASGGGNTTSEVKPSFDLPRESVLTRFKSPPTKKETKRFAAMGLGAIRCPIGQSAEDTAKEFARMTERMIPSDDTRPYPVALAENLDGSLSMS